jgi:hypothetical protein
VPGGSLHPSLELARPWHVEGRCRATVRLSAGECFYDDVASDLNVDSVCREIRSHWSALAVAPDHAELATGLSSEFSSIVQG